MDVMEVEDSGEVSGDGMLLSVSIPLASLLPPASGVSARRRLSRLFSNSRARSRTCSPIIPTLTRRLSLHSSPPRRRLRPGTSMRSGEKRPDEPVEEAQDEDEDDDGVPVEEE